MATVQISELTAISTATTDDNFIINDGNAATRRITFADLVTSVANQAITFTQDITFSGATSGISIDELSDVDTTTAAPTTGQVLKWSGTSWAPADDSLSAAFELGTGEILNRAATRGHVIKLRNLSDVNKILLNTGTGDIDSQGNISGAQIQVDGAQITLSDLADGSNLTTLTGVAADAAHLGTFTGTTIADSSTIKTALQALETSLEAIDIDTDDLAALTGISENTTNLGTFTGSTISDNVAVKVALQEVETALELRAPLATPSFTGHVYTPELRATGTGHLKLRAETGNDLNIYLNDTETLQITRDPSTGNPKFTAKGGTGECEFLQSVNLDAGFKIGGVAVSATAAELNLLDGVTATTAELNYVDGVTSDIQTQLDARALSSAISNVDNTSDADKPVSTAQQTALDAKAGLAGGNTFTGTQVVRDKIDIKPADSTYFLRLNRNTTTQLDIATGNIPSGGNLNLKNSNGTDAKVVVYSDLFWVRNLGGSNGNGTAKFDGAVEVGSLNIGGDDVTTTVAELNLLDGVTATTAELNILDGVTATAAELNYVDGVTSAIQTQIDAKAAVDSPTFTTKIESPEFHSVGTGHLKFKGGGNDIIFYPQDTETLQITRSGTDCRFTSNGGSGTFKFNQDVTQRPSSSVTPSANGDLSVEATSNTTLTFKFKGDDGVVRSGTITLS